jgi:NIPSNAP protein
MAHDHLNSLLRHLKLRNARETVVCRGGILGHCLHSLRNRYAQDCEVSQYARIWPKPVQRCGGGFVGYFLPTKIAGPTNFALALIDFENVAAYEQYREALMREPDTIADVEFVENSGCIPVEDRSILQRAS